VTISFGIPARVKMQVTDDGWLRSGFCEREFEGGSLKRVHCWAGVMSEPADRVHSQRTPLLFPLTEQPSSRVLGADVFFE